MGGAGAAAGAGESGVTAPRVPGRAGGAALEFGATVAVPGILALPDRHDLRATWFVPAHTAQVFPDAVKAVADRGHEVAAHSMYHAPYEVGLATSAIPPASPERQRGYIEEQTEILERVTGQRPVGFRSPIGAWVGEHVPLGYYLNPENPWFSPAPFGTVEQVLGNFTGSFDACHEHVPGGVWNTILHPQCCGRDMKLTFLDRLFAHVRDHDDVWVATMSEVTEAYDDALPDPTPGLAAATAS
jgi:peptidoglycan/xylan/chitin deacetylase (PgdA/CDA1 family)